MKNKRNAGLMKRIIGLFLFSILFDFAATAKIVLPGFFSDNMVIQQKTNDAIWGWSSPNTKVTLRLSWNQQLFSVISGKDGRWKLSVPAPSAGGPYTMHLKDADSEITLKNILCGEVWFCSGQSNMEMPVMGYEGQPVNGSQDVIAQAANSQIHLLRVEHRMSEKPLDNIKESWTECNAETVQRISAVAYSFGKYIQETVHVPVGIIHSNYGGTRIECWMSEDTLKTFSFEDSALRVQEKNPNTSPTVLYNAMVAPFVGYGIKGCLWYQGESNRFEADEYTQLMPALINSWRTKWGIGDFSFYYVQIAPYFYWNENNNSSFLRESQLRAMSKTKNCGMAVTLDIGGERDIHPKEKFLVGRRLAYWALAKDYGMSSLQFSGPVYKEMKLYQDTAKLYFDFSSNGLILADTLVSNFEIAGNDKIFHPAKVEITGTNELSVWNKNVAKPVAVRYAWRNWVVGNFFNTAGLPASSFRTDDW